MLQKASLKVFKLWTLPRNKFGIITRAYSDRKNRYLDDTGCYCKRLKVCKCLPKDPGSETPPGISDPADDDPCYNPPECCDDERLKRDPCYQRRIPREKPLKLTRDIPKMVKWEFSADCCGNPCPEMLPRFDTLYYRMKDKMKAKYQQTWVECPERKRPKYKSCVFIDELPPLYRRERKRKPPHGLSDDELLERCCLAADKHCVKVKSPGCRLCRIPPKCHQNRDPGDCKKRCCPYPAFSECCRRCPRKQRDRECECLRFRMKCEAYKVLKRKLMYVLPPNLPEWPPKMVGPSF